MVYVSKIQMINTSVESKYEYVLDSKTYFSDQPINDLFTIPLFHLSFIFTTHFFKPLSYQLTDLSSHSFAIYVHICINDWP
jgi:hypothetical protein